MGTRLWARVAWMHVAKTLCVSCILCILCTLCPGRDLNPHALEKQRILSPPCLPIPPPGRDGCANLTGGCLRRLFGARRRSVASRICRLALVGVLFGLVFFVCLSDWRYWRFCGRHRSAGTSRIWLTGRASPDRADPTPESGALHDLPTISPRSPNTSIETLRHAGESDTPQRV